MAPANIHFGDGTDDTVRPANYFGRSGWFRVADTWFAHTDANGQVWASPHSDFSPPSYSCKLNHDGTLVFQDLSRSAILDEQRHPAHGL